MIIVKENSVKSRGLLVGEPIIIKTRCFDLQANEKYLMIDLFSYPKRFENEKIDNIAPIQIDGLAPFPIQFDVEVLSSWQKQNELVKEKLIKLGVPAENISIEKDV